MGYSDLFTGEKKLILGTYNLKLYEVNKINFEDGTSHGDYKLKSHCLYFTITTFLNDIIQRAALLIQVIATAVTSTTLQSCVTQPSVSGSITCSTFALCSWSLKYLA